MLEARHLLTGVTFATHEVIAPETIAPTAVHAADIDGDGDMDVLSASFSKIAWYENTNGQGLFGEQQIISTSAVEHQTVITADVDGDGDMDVLSASFADDKIAWYENTDGSGAFSDERIITTVAAGVQAVFAADLDGDGDMDIISGSADDDTIAWYENTDGRGNFGQSQVISTVADKARSVSAVDIDGDGDVDVLSASEDDDKIAWYENIDGRGTFGPQRVITTIADRTRYVTAADVDLDGDMDVLSTSIGDDKVAWYENTDGQGNFGPQQVISTTSPNVGPIHVADMDGDGDVDVLTARGGKIAWFPNVDGAGGFGPERIVANNLDLTSDVFAADLDGDGYLDVVSAFVRENKIAWYAKNIRTGGYGPQTPLTALAPLDRPDEVVAADIDGDGDVDFFAADNGLTWFENIDGQGNFGPPNVIDIATRGIITAADIDGDGDIDLLSQSTSRRIVWYENLDGNGNFGPAITNDAETCDRDLPAAAVDMDGDGDLDILGTGQCGDGPAARLVWYRNIDGNGTFGPRQPIAEIFSQFSSNFASIVAADVDGDGDMDVFAQSVGDSGREFRWYENLTGAGFTWLPHPLIASYSSSANAFAADLDQDGDVDVLTSDPNGGINWFENTDGRGNFGAAQIVHEAISRAATARGSVSAADIDNDGDLDVLANRRDSDPVAANCDCAELLWFENVDGNGDFGAAQAIGFGLDLAEDYLAREFAAADLDGDGDLDVVAPWEIEDSIRWYENRPVMTGDFNRDGVFDDTDIDSLVAEIAAASHDDSFDMTGDGLVDLADRDAWLVTAGAANLGAGRTYLLGDANLDGAVDLSDLMRWNQHKFTFTAAWTAGDFSADGRVDELDFNIWNDHKFQNGASCDFNSDGSCDVDDLDLFYLELGGSDPAFNLDGAGIVDNDDLTEWLGLASVADSQGRDFLRGDTNLDGLVGGDDLTTLILNFGADGGWRQGNFVVDPVAGGGTVGGPDFTALALNFGSTSGLLLDDLHANGRPDENADVYRPLIDFAMSSKGRLEKSVPRTTSVIPPSFTRSSQTAEEVHHADHSGGTEFDWPHRPDPAATASGLPEGS